MLARVPSVWVMDDETLMRHLEVRHGADLRMRFLVEPGRVERRLRAPRIWRAFHSFRHRFAPDLYPDHVHEEDE